MPEADRSQRIAEAVKLLASLFPYRGENLDGWPRSAQLLAHTQAMLDHARAVELTSTALSELLSRTGSYLWGRRLNLRLAEELHEQALAMHRRLYDGDHPAVAASLNNLALDLRTLGDHERSRELDEQALAMRRRLAERQKPSAGS